MKRQVTSWEKIFTIHISDKVLVNRSYLKSLQLNKKTKTPTKMIQDLKRHFIIEDISSVQSFSRVWLFATPWIAACHQLLESTQTHVHWVSDAIQSAHPLSSPSPPPQSFPASGSFQMSQLFASGGQSIGVSASTSVLSINNQDWFPLGWTDWISLQSNGLSRVFSNTTVQKHQFFGSQLSL